MWSSAANYFRREALIRSARKHAGKRMLFWLSCLVLVAAILLGGGTHAGFLGDVAVQLLSVPLLAVSLWPALSTRDPHREKARLAFALCCIVALVTLVQVLPLPFDIWAGGASLLTWPSQSDAEPQRAAWGTFSLTPQATWAAAASVIVPLSIFGAVTQLGLSHRMKLSWILLGLGALSLLLGFMQVAQGTESSLRFYEFTNQHEAVGFFANRNHFAALLNVSLVLAAVWFAIIAEGAMRHGTLGSRSTLVFVAAAIFLVAIVAGLVFARSRAGILLAVFVLAGIFTIILGRRHSSSYSGVSRDLKVRRASFAVIAFAILFAAQFGLSGLFARQDLNPIEDLRLTINRTTWQTIPKALPFGTGLGSFTGVYAAVEPPQDAMAGYVNHAHNEFSEFLLETGLIGAILLVAFLVWFARRFYAVWKQPRTSPSQLMLERASILIIPLLLAHSLVDYPLRTTAISAVFAFFCAILAAPAAIEAPIDNERPHSSHRRRHGANLPVSTLPPVPEKWGTGIGWPEGWQKREE